MRPLTVNEVCKAKDAKSVVTLASSRIGHETELPGEHKENRKLEYDFLFKAYTIHTENGTITTDKVKEAVHRYNTGDMTLQKYNEA